MLLDTYAPQRASSAAAKAQTGALDTCYAGPQVPRARSATTVLQETCAEGVTSSLETLTTQLTWCNDQQPWEVSRWEADVHAQVTVACGMSWRASDFRRRLWLQHM